MMVPSSEQLHSGKGWACDLTSHQSLLLRRDDRGDSPLEFCVHGKWTRMVDVPHVGEWKYSFRYRGARKPRGIVSLVIYIYFLFLMNASISTLTMKSAKHGTCWMSHTSAKGVGHEQHGRAQRKTKNQRGRASPLLPLLGRRPHIVVLVV